MKEYSKDDFVEVYEFYKSASSPVVVLDIVFDALKIAANVMDDAVLEKACWSREQHLKRVDWARKVLQK